MGEVPRRQLLLTQVLMTHQLVFPVALTATMQRLLNTFCTTGVEVLSQTPCRLFSGSGCPEICCLKL